jgi:hypothetical protein
MSENQRAFFPFWKKDAPAKKERIVALTAWVVSILFCIVVICLYTVAHLNIFLWLVYAGFAGFFLAGWRLQVVASLAAKQGEKSL